MKKFLIIILISAILSLQTTGIVFAEKKNPVIRGEITDINEGDGTVSILTEDGETVVINVPQGFDFSSLAIGLKVQAKIRKTQSGSTSADWIKAQGSGDNEVEVEEDEGKDEGEKPEGKLNSSFCSEKKEKPHPFAAAISESYGVEISDVMGYFCNGYGFGEIMLALQTNRINGGDVGEMLGLRRSGKGWGQIWQEMELIGNRDKAKTPPGQLKKSGG